MSHKIANTTPRVSVVMCVYNTKSYLAQAIESVLQQTMKDFEFLIIDDGSTDGSWDVIQHYAQQDQRIKASQHTHNQGIAATRKQIMQQASAPYIAIQDSDDISFPERLAL